MSDAEGCTVETVRKPRDRNSRELPDPLIELRDVHKSFDGITVLDGMSLEIHPGEITVILGPSGTGKSVLLKHMVGLLKPDSGEVWFEGERIDTCSEAQLVEVRRRMGYLFQLGALFDSMTVAENICFPLVEHNSVSEDEKRERCHRVLKIVGLEGIEEKSPAELSGGQQKRVALARAIILEPDVIFYDEPTTGLDPVRADLIDELMRSLNDNLGITSVVVTHDIDSARKIADRMVMLYDGKVLADGSPESFENAGNDFVRRFIQGQASEEDLALIRQGFSGESES
ncbi:MAG: ABC transporter ATP-binding protein [Phycisphaeraceae bacterium]|nr:ABC transporter ATP-binding protein [Phycisphaeraceae bacterium]